MKYFYFFGAFLFLALAIIHLVQHGFGSAGLDNLLLWFVACSLLGRVTILEERK